MLNIRDSAQALINARRQHPAWRLLAARSAPLVLGCLESLFTEAEDGVETEVALQTLSELLAEHANDEDFRVGDGNHVAHARREVNEWRQRRLIIEREGRLYATDALETALDFIRRLDQRLMTSTASRLSVVQREIENLDVALNPDPKLRGQHIRQKIAALERELERIQKGDVPIPSREQAVEGIREIYSLATGLRADFRRVEDSYRSADHALRESIIANQSHRGEILDELLNGHEGLLETAEGQVFQGFFEQLQQDSSMRMVRYRLRNIISHPYAEGALNESQRNDLRWLFARLNRESETVLRARERSEQDVKGFLKTGLVDEHHRVGRLLEEIQHVALNIEWEQHALRTSPSCLPPVAVNCYNLPLIERLRSKSLHEDQAQELELTEQHTNLMDVEDDFWLSFDSLDLQALLEDTQKLLRESDGAQSLAQLAEQLPPSHDLETLAFWLGMAREAGLPIHADSETITLEDGEQADIRWCFTVPKVAFTAEAMDGVDWDNKL